MASYRDQLPSEVLAYFDAIDEKVKAFQEATSKIADEPVNQQCGIFVETFTDVIPRYLLLAQAYSAPAPNEVMVVFKVLASKIQEIGAIADKNKGEDSYQMLMAIQSASDALNWVTVSPKPANSIGDAYDGCLYYANRVSKDRGDDGKAWVKALSQLLNAMKAYVIDYHKSGLMWKGSSKCPATLREADISTLVAQLSLSGGASSAASGASVSCDSGDDSPYLQELSASLDDLMEKSKALGDLLEQQMTKFDSIARVVIPKYLSMAEQHQAPPQSDYPKVFSEMIEVTGQIVSMSDSTKPTHPQSLLLNTVKSAAEHFNWVVAPGRPQDFVKECMDSTTFYGNKAIKAGGDEEKAWFKSLAQYMRILQQTLKDFYPSGLVWKGKTPIGQSSGAAAPPPPPPGGLPPPPPPVAASAHSGGSSSGDDGRTELFSQLNKGTDITKGLKKVTKDMQTHKHPELRAGAVVTAVEKKGEGASAAKPAAAKVEKPPKMELVQDKKWIVENYKDETVTIEISDFKHTVYAFNCKNTTFIVKNKVNFISLDNCAKCGVVFDDLLSSVDLVNCKSVQIQALSKMPLLNIDKTDGVQVYLSPECLDVEIVTAKSSEMNVLVPQEDGDFSEFPIPEQYKTVFDSKKKRLVTTCSESLG